MVPACNMLAHGSISNPPPSISKYSLCRRDKKSLFMKGIMKNKAVYAEKYQYTLPKDNFSTIFVIDFIAFGSRAFAMRTQLANIRIKTENS
jgi:hypothetical protein